MQHKEYLKEIIEKFKKFFLNGPGALVAAIVLTGLAAELGHLCRSFMR